MPQRLILPAHEKDLGGGFRVRRLLPSAARQAVGPFLFFDHFGPVEAGPQDNHDVRPHPHTGLATVTYLFEGAMMHRDSTGAVQRIEPGAVNWMTAGRGIVHSERTPDDLRGVRRRSHGLQLWSALPVRDEEMAPSFSHTPAEAIPVREVGGATVRVLIGQAYGAASPVLTRSPTLYLDIALRAGAQLQLPPAAERALYAPQAPFTLDGQPQPAQRMVVLAEGEQPLLSAPADMRIALIGGEPLGHRFMVWNFVSSRKERIAQAQDDWRAQRFDPVPGETEFIPLP
jgi:redox-sensitive bicupin YhaK (pirin superfamily)